MYTPLSWDTNSRWKSDLDTFLFNLNKNRKYKKLRSEFSIYCSSINGPWTYGFGFGFNKTNMKKLRRGSDLNSFYENGSDILDIKLYNILEVEAFKVIIE